LSWGNFNAREHSKLGRKKSRSSRQYYRGGNEKKKTKHRVELRPTQEKDWRGFDLGSASNLNSTFLKNGGQGKRGNSAINSQVSNKGAKSASEDRKTRDADQHQSIIINCQWEGGTQKKLKISVNRRTPKISGQERRTAQDTRAKKPWPCQGVYWTGRKKKWGGETGKILDTKSSDGLRLDLQGSERERGDAKKDERP